MPTWCIESEGTAREIYNVEAETLDEARAMFNQGDCGRPFLTEVSDSEIVTIEKCD